MKAGKAPVPSGRVVEMIRAAGDMGASMICGRAAAIIGDSKVPSDWEQNFIVCLYKGKWAAFERGNCCSLKLTEQVMKVLERIVDGLIRQLMSVDDSHFGFVPSRDTTDAIFVVRQLQEKYLAAIKRLYMAFVDLESECVKSLLTWKKTKKMKGLRVNAGKKKIMICGTGLDSCKVQASFHVPSVALEWAATASSAMAASTRYTRKAVGSSA